MSKRSITTGKGDKGETAFLGGQRIHKSELRPQASGALDEASAFIGLARCKASTPVLNDLLIRIQNHIYLINAELALAADKKPFAAKSILSEHLDWLNQAMQELEHGLNLPQKFVLYGETELSALLDIARAVVRRAESLVVALHDQKPLKNDHLLPYLNRLSDFLYLLARHHEANQGIAFRHPE